MIYAVNKLTKEHRLLEHRDFGPGRSVDDWHYVNCDADGWIEWKGGDQPMPDLAKCQLKDNAVSGEEWIKFKAEEVKWDSPTTITHYRPILNAEETEMEQEWSGEGLPPVGTVCELSGDCGFYSLQRDQITELEEGEHVVVIGHAVRHDNGCTCITIQSMNDLSIGFSTGNSECMVRPIKTDRDRWIDLAGAIESCMPDSYQPHELLAKLYDSGLAKLPEQTK